MQAQFPIAIPRLPFGQRELQSAPKGRLTLSSNAPVFEVQYGLWKAHLKSALAFTCGAQAPCNGLFDGAIDNGGYSGEPSQPEHRGTAARRTPSRISNEVLPRLP